MEACTRSRDRSAQRRLIVVNTAILLANQLGARWRSTQFETLLATDWRYNARPSGPSTEAAIISDSSRAYPTGTRSPHGIYGRAGRWLDHSQSRRCGCSYRKSSVAGLSAPRNQAAGEDAGIPAPY